MSDKILDTLNDKQREAVEYIDGALLVLAGAGSGKTRVITHRFAHILREKHLHMRNILAVTFTNKAANEMKERIAYLTGRDAFKAWVRTFHSTGLLIIRDNPELIGYPSNFSIYDDTDSKNLVKTIMKDLNFDINTFAPASVYGAISRAKDLLISAGEYELEANSEFKEVVSKTFFAYEDNLRKNRAVDFADLIALPIRMFRENPDFLDKYRSIWKYIMVDEFQDTNKSQYELLKLIIGDNNNICVVGDDDQSIYGWRGAVIDNIYDFEKRYNAKVIPLEQNYRSTNIILESANEIVQKIPDRMSKRLWTERVSEDKIGVMECADSFREAYAIANKIKEEIEQNNYSYKDFAVFYRTNAQSRHLEEAMRRLNIPYMIFGGQKFYERKEIKDILAYIKLIVNPYDFTSFERIINVPSRKIGDITQKRITGYALSKGISYIEAITDAKSAGLKGGVLENAVNLGEILFELNQSVENLSPTNFVKILIDAVRFKDYISGYDSDGLDRWSNVEELINSIRIFETINPELNIADFLNEVSLQSSIDDMENERDYVSLMTIHNAKGLEFGVVFVSGVVNGLIPHSSSINSIKEMNEERRLFYVAITRAKDKLYLSYPLVKMSYGENSDVEASEFLAEIPEQYIEMTEKTEFYAYDKPSVKTSSRNSFYKPKRETKIPVSQKIEIPVITSDRAKTAKISSIKDISVGDKVIHGVFGIGKVEFVSEKMIQAKFEDYGLQQIGGNVALSIQKVVE